MQFSVRFNRPQQSYIPLLHYTCSVTNEIAGNFGFSLTACAKPQSNQVNKYSFVWQQQDTGNMFKKLVSGTVAKTVNNVRSHIIQKKFCLEFSLFESREKKKKKERAGKGTGICLRLAFSFRASAKL